MRLSPSVFSIALVGFVSIFIAGCGPFPIDSGTVNPSDLDASSSDEDDSDHGSSGHGGPVPPPMPDLDPYVRIVSPTHGDTVDNPVSFVVEGLDVSSLRLEADGWLITNWVPNDFTSTKSNHGE